MASVARPLSIPLPNGAHLHLVSLVPFGLIHLAALGIFFFPFKWSYLVTAFALYEVRMFFVTAGYHRYFSHRSFKTSRWFQFVIAFLAMSSSQKGVLWWAAHHRHHHRYSDLEEDLHSPTLFGFWWSHIGWILSDRYNDTRFDYIGDFAKFPELRWLNKYYLAPPITLGVVLWLIGSWPLLIWGFFLSTVFLWQARSPSIRFRTSSASAAFPPPTRAKTTGCSLWLPSAKAGTTITTTSWPPPARVFTGGRSISPITA